MSVPSTVSIMANAVSGRSRRRWLLADRPGGRVRLSSPCGASHTSKTHKTRKTRTHLENDDILGACSSRPDLGARVQQTDETNWCSSGRSRRSPSNARPLYFAKATETSEPGKESKGDDRQGQAKEDSDSQKASNAVALVSEGPHTDEMDAASSCGNVTKRTYDQAAGEYQKGDPTSEEPPPKAAITRRPIFRPKPNIPPDRKPAGLELK
ncbi:hypothetical protein HPB52_005109 [Rhipicephalus sanguineus]|uniref:Uncharacterized protein n=1 Tax=Rhipicephalus sanguineus TaxID=34632 RepID=A0A9D4T2W1_RHISA|nr:hypothetical protein HPB52_005109 [Rhipicephalus sanguineus]